MEEKRIISLTELPTWAEMAPSVLRTVRRPADGTVRYAPDAGANSLVSLLPGGDSTVLAVDAIVNAANSELYPGGGICGAIHCAAGPQLAAACAEIGHTKTGHVAVTPGFDLPARYVIHAVGPIGERPEKLREAYEATLRCIDGERIRSVALCCISTGIYGYPIVPATHIALDTVRRFLDAPGNREKVDRIVFVVFMSRDVLVYKNLMPLYFPLEDGAAQFMDDGEEEEKE